MSRLGAQPKLRFKADGPAITRRYFVYLGDDHIGFVRKYDSGNKWNAVDVWMEKAQDFNSREDAAAWLKREFDQAVKAEKTGA